MTTPAGAPRAREIVRIADLNFLRALAHRIGEVHLTAFAAGIAYGAVFALVPMLALLVLLLGLFNAEQFVDRALDELVVLLPADMVSLIDDQLRAVAATDDRGSFGIGVVTSAAIAMWGASGAMRRVMEALNALHRVDDGRGFVGRLLVSMVLAVGAIVAVAITVAVIVLGGDVAERVFDVLGIPGAESVWAWMRWPLLLVIAWLAIAIAYRVAPASRQVGGIATPGTLLATFGWVGFSVLFSWYVGSVGAFGASWGAVAGVVVFLLYLQYTGLIVLAGALVDVLLWDRAHPPSRIRRALHRTSEG